MTADPQKVCRVAVFVDWQNCYRSARDAFGFAINEAPSKEGTVKPALLCLALAKTRPEGITGELVKARIYTGRASQKQDAKTYAANRRQFDAWQRSDERIEVIARTLDYKLGRPREKGIDVKLAIDLVRTTLFENEHDVAVVVSADTDLLPALELIAERAAPEAVEVATWSGGYWSPNPLQVAGRRIKQHRMSGEFYEKIADDRDYAVDVRALRLPPRSGETRFLVVKTNGVSLGEMTFGRTGWAVGDVIMRGAGRDLRVVELREAKRRDELTIMVVESA
jgi:uncharacterized LabA/DUF88 family protein